jgi:hypothetical protein
MVHRHLRKIQIQFIDCPTIPRKSEISNSQGEPIPPDNFLPPNRSLLFHLDQAFQRLPEREIVPSRRCWMGIWWPSHTVRKEDALPLSQRRIRQLEEWERVLGNRFCSKSGYADL